MDNAHFSVHIRLAKYVKFREERFGGILFDTRSERVFTLNPTGAAVVRQIEAGHEQDAISAHLMERFSGTDASIESDVAAFIDGLRQKGLIEQ